MLLIIPRMLFAILILSFSKYGCVLDRLQRGHFDPKFQVEGAAPPIIFARIVRRMNVGCYQGQDELMTGVEAIDLGD